MQCGNTNGLDLAARSVLRVDEYAFFFFFNHVAYEKTSLMGYYKNIFAIHLLWLHFSAIGRVRKRPGFCVTGLLFFTSPMAAKQPVTVSAKANNPNDTVPAIFCNHNNNINIMSWFRKRLFFSICTSELLQSYENIIVVH